LVSVTYTRYSQLIFWIVPDARSEAAHGCCDHDSRTNRQRPGPSSSTTPSLAQVEREVRELGRANAVLRLTSAFFAGDLDRPLRWKSWPTNDEQSHATW